MPASYCVARSGCKALFLGLETISQESLNGANKRHNRSDEYREVIRRCHARGIAVQAGVVFGFDHDDRSIFRTTVEFYRSAGLDSATISVLIPFPGTPLFKRLDSEGRILTYDWSKYNGAPTVAELRTAVMALSPAKTLAVPVGWPENVGSLSNAKNRSY